MIRFYCVNSGFKYKLIQQSLFSIIPGKCLILRLNYVIMVFQACRSVSVKCTWKSWFKVVYLPLSPFCPAHHRFLAIYEGFEL